jgi:hypothetical protein
VEKERLLEQLNKYKTLQGVADFNGVERQNIHYYVKKYGLKCELNKVVYFVDKLYKHKIRKVKTERIWK